MVQRVEGLRQGERRTTVRAASAMKGPHSTASPAPCRRLLGGAPVTVALALAGMLSVGVTVETVTPATVPVIGSALDVVGEAAEHVAGAIGDVGDATVECLTDPGRLLRGVTGPAVNLPARER